MGKSGVSINWGGLMETVGRAAVALADTQSLMTIVGRAMKGQTTRRFNSGTGPDGTAWQALAGPRKNSKGQKRGGTARPLVDTGRLRNSISFSATPAEVFVGSNVEYARIHQLGGQAGRGRKVKIPARPYLGVGEEDKEEIQALCQEWLAGCFRK